jgi:hypothetical protein
MDPYPSEPGLFAEPPRRVPVPQQRTRRPISRPPHTAAAGGDAPVINNMDVIEAVLNTAREHGYLLVGEQEQVWRRAGEDVLEPTTAREAAAVCQLLGAGLLTLGGWHPVTRHGRPAQGRSALVPASSRALSRRIAGYRRPVSWGSATRTGNTGERP